MLARRLACKSAAPIFNRTPVPLVTSTRILPEALRGVCISYHSHGGLGGVRGFGASCAAGARAKRAKVKAVEELEEGGEEVPKQRSRVRAVIDEEETPKRTRRAKKVEDLEEDEKPKRTRRAKKMEDIEEDETLKRTRRTRRTKTAADMEEDAPKRTRQARKALEDANETPSKRTRRAKIIGEVDGHDLPREESENTRSLLESLLAGRPGDVSHYGEDFEGWDLLEVEEDVDEDVDEEVDVEWEDSDRTSQTLTPTELPTVTTSEPYTATELPADIPIELQTTVPLEPQTTIPLEPQTTTEPPTTPKKPKTQRVKTKYLLSDLVATAAPLPPLAPKVPPQKRTRKMAVTKKDDKTDDTDDINVPPKVKAKGKRTPKVAPQGLIPSPDETAGDPEPAYPTTIQQARVNMARFPNCVLITRVGGFYELYFEHASEIGPALGIKVFGRKTVGGVVPMAGFPFFQLERHLKILVQDMGKQVAIAEEFPYDAGDRIKMGGLMNDRKVARVITPGTLVDETFIDPYSNNYVMAICEEAADSATTKSTSESIVAPPNLASALADTPLGLAWVDTSTGQFYTQSITLSSLGSILSRTCPREVVIGDALRLTPEHPIFSVLAEDRHSHLLSYASSSPDHNPPRDIDDWTPFLENEVPAAARAAFTPLEISSCNMLLGYVSDRLRGVTMRLQPPQRRAETECMAIDKSTMRSLEIRTTMRDGVFRGSVLHAIRRTATRSGARLLAEWLASPSTSLQVITERQDLVARFLADADLCDEVVVLLRRCHDARRLVQKFTMGRGDPDDLLALAQTVDAVDGIVGLLTEAAAVDSGTLTAPTKKSKTGTPKTKSKIKTLDTKNGSPLFPLISRIDLATPRALAHRIRSAIDEAGLMEQNELRAREASDLARIALGGATDDGTTADDDIVPKTTKSWRKPALSSIYRDVSIDEDAGTGAWTMRPDASPTLHHLHATLAELRSEQSALQDNLRVRFGVPSLTLRTHSSHGNVCHIRGARDVRIYEDTPTLSSNSRSLGPSRSTRTFHLPEWTTLGAQIVHVHTQICTEEQRVLETLRHAVVANISLLRRNAAVIDELDVAASFARLASEQNLVRPIMTQSTAHVILGGRHPTVEGGLCEQGRSFVRNDCHVGSPGHGRAWLITGPNMAGKSTFLRQNALITILAQIGSYVPADYAEIGLVDAIFSRVGSADNLYRDQSTFMVEMLETAHILRHATPKSFVIMDEIGRGTTPHDGTAVAFASLHHLATVNRCRTLFATHFHAVADHVREWGLHGGDGVEEYCNNVEENGKGGFIYIHKLQRGVNRQSHALKVAGIAGLPGAAMETARKILNK